MFRFSGRVRSSAFPVGEHSALSGGDFQGIGVYRSDGCSPDAQGASATLLIVSMSPTRLIPRRGLLPCKARIRLAYTGLQREAKWLEGENNYTAPKDFP